MRKIDSGFTLTEIVLSLALLSLVWLAAIEAVYIHKTISS
ncbi:MAG: prepilin-type N-terminal cleavage/methylation domain-containing protein, partial [Candidatus Omnitrophica bacterium]|nr:prepilin-type N-terminal cleavage/methylation domain-containing protein [Candidatus Omnitrophota bacterium]